MKAPTTNVRLAHFISSWLGLTTSEEEDAATQVLNGMLSHLQDMEEGLKAGTIATHGTVFADDGTEIVTDALESGFTARKTFADILAAICIAIADGVNGVSVQVVVARTSALALSSCATTTG